jgi:lysophospholipase L1-like esterase
MLFQSLLLTRSKFTRPFRQTNIMFAAAASVALGWSGVARADDSPNKEVSGDHAPTKWVASWTTAAQGVLNSQPGSPAPNLSFSLPDFSVGAQEQTLRLIIKPDLWGNEGRLRLTNLFGTQSVTFGSVTVGWQSSSGNITPGTLRRATFNGKSSITIPAGQEIYSDPFELVSPNNPNSFSSFDRNSQSRVGSNSGDPVLDGHKLAVNLYVQGTSGPITYHASAFQTSYLSAPGSGDHTGDNDDSAYPYTTTSWFFLGALEVKAVTDTRVIVATGASVVDGTSSTLNGNDRWSDDLSRRVHEAYGRKVSVVNTGIAGDTAALPPAGANRSLSAYFQERLNRDVIGVAGVTDVILYDGPNDYGSFLIPASGTIAAYQTIVARVHLAGLKIYGATLSSPKGDPNGYYSTPGGLANRLIINEFIRTSGLFDGVEDFDAATLDPATGAILPQYVPNTTTGAAGDYLHPNRAGYQAEANSIDIRPFAP